LKYGNCLAGAFFLLWRERHNRPRFIVKRRPGTLVSHFMVRSETGLHHYRVSEEILPWPLCYIVFRGRFQTAQPGDETDFDKPSFSSLRSSRASFSLAPSEDKK
jgi:hypothetical protein